jgi:hypothetical protein
LGHKYSLILSRIITDEESAILLESGCSSATFVIGSLPTDPEVKVTKVDIDDTVSPSLEKAIESGLEAVIQVPDLSLSGLHVPALPVEGKAEPVEGKAEPVEDKALPVEGKADRSAVVAGEVVDDELGAGSEVEVAEANAKQAVNGKAKRTANGKASAKRTVKRKTAEATDDAKDAKGAKDAKDAKDAKELSAAAD